MSLGAVLATAQKDQATFELQENVRDRSSPSLSRLRLRIPRSLITTHRKTPCFLQFTCQKTREVCLKELTQQYQY